MIYRAAQISKYGDPSSIRIVELPNREPDAHEVRIRVEASSLVFTDILLRRNLYPVMKPKLPFILGYSLVGRVDKKGPEAFAQFSVGDRVAALTQIGSNSDLFYTSDSLLVRVPEEIEAAEAEVMILSGMTALQSLKINKQLQPGSRLLVTGASGAVGQLALQLARQFEIVAVGISSEKNSDFVRSAGATAINYDTPDYISNLEKLTEKPFDLIIDLTGDLPITKLRSFLTDDGAVVFAGLRSAWRTKDAKKTPGFLKQMYLAFKFLRVSLFKFAKKKKVIFYDISSSQTTDPTKFQEDLEFLFGLIEKRILVPFIQERISLSHIAEGHRLIESGKVKGRLVTVHSVA
ncbi:MAG: zinc-binding dehydrogenase [Pseudobdellovibrionaceae bacterium]